MPTARQIFFALAEAIKDGHESSEEGVWVFYIDDGHSSISLTLGADGEYKISPIFYPQSNPYNIFKVKCGTAEGCQPTYEGGTIRKLKSVAKCLGVDLNSK